MLPAVERVGQQFPRRRQRRTGLLCEVGTKTEKEEGRRRENLQGFKLTNRRQSDTYGERRAHPGAHPGFLHAIRDGMG